MKAVKILTAARFGQLELLAVGIGERLREAAYWGSSKYPEGLGSNNSAHKVFTADFHDPTNDYISHNQS